MSLGGTQDSAGVRRATARRAPAMVQWRLAALLLLAIPASLRAQTPSHREGPYDIPLFNTARTAGASGVARLFYASSPFGVAVTVDGVDRYDVRVTVKGLPAPASLGPYRAYLAWEVTPDLATWTRLGPVHDGTVVVGTTSLDKFLFVVTAERSAGVAAHAGPVVLHGTSPSGWLENFLSHNAFFRGVY